LVVADGKLGSEDSVGSTCSDSDIESEDIRRSCHCGWRCCCCCCFCCSMNVLALVLTVIALIYYMNVWVKYAIETVGSAVLGTEVSLDALTIALTQGRVSISNMTVASPASFEDSFVTLGRFVLDVDPKSVLAAWLSGFCAPVVLEEFSVFDIRVAIDMNWTAHKDNRAVSNVQRILSHMNEVTKELRPIAPEQPTTPTPEEMGNEALHAMITKIRADRIELANISCSALIRPFLSVPVTFTLKEVLVKDVGKTGNGVYLWELVEILTRAILMAVIKSAPDNIRANLAKVLGPGLFRELDFSEILYDTGEGLHDIGEFSGWAAGEAALLPLRFAALQARITGKAISTGAKMNLEAAKVGAELTGAAIRGQLAATNTAVKAGVAATNALTKLRTGFTTGFTGALLR